MSHTWEHSLKDAAEKISICKEQRRNKLHTKASLGKRATKHKTMEKSGESGKFGGALKAK